MATLQCTITPPPMKEESRADITATIQPSIQMQKIKFLYKTYTPNMDG